MLQRLSIYNCTRTSLSTWQRIIEKLRAPFFQFILNICVFIGKKKNVKKSHHRLAIQTHACTNSSLQCLYEYYIWNTTVLGSQLMLLSHCSCGWMRNCNFLAFSHALISFSWLYEKEGRWFLKCSKQEENLYYQGAEETLLCHNHLCFGIILDW